ncbi:MAG: ABC transporter permease [Clostridia bacterium]|nr:ABC transporter permease [Clostridia bacterium]
MGSLIKNELIKIFRKKSTYIVLIILAAFVILTNLIYKFMLSTIMPDNYRSSEQYISYAKEQLKNMSPETDREEYINLKTEVDLYELENAFDEGSWQMYIVNRDFGQYIRDINIEKYGSEADKAVITNNPQEVYNKELNKLKNSDWKQYAKEEIAELESEIEEVKIQRNLFDTISPNSQEIDVSLKVLETRLEMAKLRIEKDIPYGHNYMNDAIQTIINSADLDYEYDNQGMSYQEKLAKQEAIEKYEKAKYVIEKRQDINNYSSARGVLLNSFDEYSIFLVIFVVMIAGGIVSSEFEKGTIKMLLVKPYKRWKILLAKYIVSLLMIGFIFIVTMIMQVIIGGILFGFNSLAVPAVVYNFSTNSLETYNLFAYWGILAISKLPIYLLLGTLAFAISCIFGNTVLSIVLPIIGNIGGAIVNSIVSMKPIKHIAAFPTLNWDFSQFLFGHLPTYEFTNVRFATIVCLIYFVIMIAGSWTAFNKKEIKNV